MGTFWQPIPRLRLARAAALLCALAIGASQAQAQDGDDTRASGPNREGEYGGVVPDRAPDPGDRRRVRKKRKNAISWIGFQAKEGGRARLFLRMANELEYAQHLQDNVLYVNIAEARYRHRNTSRRLDMRHFDTSLLLLTSKRVSARKARGTKHARKRGIELRITFKDNKDATEGNASMVAGKDGYMYLYLDFPAPAGSGRITIGDPEG